MRNETTAPRTPDARSVGFSKQLHAKSVSGVLDAVREVGLMSGNSVPGSIAKSYYPDSAEVKDGIPPVASVGVDAFELVGLMFVAAGEMSETRFRRAVDNVRKAVQR